jgi:hypothetical protein
MTFGRLICEPLSVREVINDADLDNQHLVVHGLFYLGECCAEDEYLLLPEDRRPRTLSLQGCTFVASRVGGMPCNEYSVVPTRPRGQKKDRGIFTWNIRRHSPVTLGSKRSEPAANTGKKLAFPHPDGRESR